MLTGEGCSRRQQRLWSAVPADIDWLLVGDARHICWLTGFWVRPLSFSAGEHSLLLLSREGKSTLFADNFVRRSAASEPYVTEEVTPRWYDHRHSVGSRERLLADAFAGVAGKLPASTGWIEREAVPYSLGGDLPAGGNLGDVIRRLRRSKDDDEVALLRSCMRAGAAGQARAFDVVRPGITEFEVYCQVQAAAQEAAGQPVLVYGDFRATNAALPKAGGPPGNTRLANGDLMILDFSVVIHGYRSDFTNTIAVGTATASQSDVFDACCRALAAAEAKLVAGADCRAVYLAASAVLSDAGYGALSHHAGHGLGLSHPEPPVLGPESDDLLLAGDVVTIEPGAYIDGVGGVRVEHNYLITDVGSERLSDHRIALA